WPDLRGWRRRSWPFQGIVFDILDEVVEVFEGAGPVDQPVAVRLGSPRGLNVGDGMHSHLDLLVLLQRQRLGRLECAVLVERFVGKRHGWWPWKKEVPATASLYPDEGMTERRTTEWR